MHRCRMHEVRGCVDVLFFECTTEVISAEVQRDLSGLLAFREPARLNVWEVLEIDTRDRDHLQVTCRRCVGRDDLLERCIAWLEAPWYECRKALILVL